MRLKPLAIILWILALASVAGYIALRTTRSAPMPSQSPVAATGAPDAEEAGQGALPSYFAIPAFELTDQHGQPFSSEALAGKLWVGFIFLTNCPTGACPVMVGKMAALQAALPDEDVHFVSFSVDPERDTPEVLARYAAEVGGGQVSDRWHLLTGGSRAEMAELARGMKLMVDEEFNHSTVFLLVDRQGNVRGTFGNSDPEGMKNLAAAAQELLGQEEPE